MSTRRSAAAPPPWRRALPRAGGRACGDGADDGLSRAYRGEARGRSPCGARARRGGPCTVPPPELIAFHARRCGSAPAVPPRARSTACVAIQGIPAAWSPGRSAGCFASRIRALVGAMSRVLAQRFDRLHRVVAPLTRRTWAAGGGGDRQQRELRALAEGRAAARRADRHGQSMAPTRASRPSESGRDACPSASLRRALSTQKGRAISWRPARARTSACRPRHDRDRRRRRGARGARDPRARGEARPSGEISGLALARGPRPLLSRVLGVRAPSLDEGRSQRCSRRWHAGWRSCHDDRGQSRIGGIRSEGWPCRRAMRRALADALATAVDLGPSKVMAMGDASRVRAVASSWQDAKTGPTSAGSRPRGELL